MHELQKHAQGTRRFTATVKTPLRHSTQNRKPQKVQDKIDYIRSNADLLRLGYGPEFTGKVQILEQRWQDLQNAIEGFDSGYSRPAGKT